MDSLLPFLQGTCTPYNMPVYPGAQCTIAESLNDSGSLSRKTRDGRAGFRAGFDGLEFEVGDAQ